MDEDAFLWGFLDGDGEAAREDLLSIDIDHDMMDLERTVADHGKEARQESKGDFIRRSVQEIRERHEGRKVTFAFRGPVQSGISQSAKALQEELTELGIPSFITDGTLEWNRDGLTKTHLTEEASTYAGEAVFINAAATNPSKNTAGHEAFHYWQGERARDVFVEILADNIDFSSSAFVEYQELISDGYLGEEVDIFNLPQINKVLEEIFAFICGDIYEGTHTDELRGILRDYDAVKTAWDTLVQSMKEQASGNIDPVENTLMDLYVHNMDPKMRSSEESEWLCGEKTSEGFASAEGQESGLVADDYVREVIRSGQMGEDGRPYLSVADYLRLNEVCKALGVRARFVDTIPNVNANARIAGAEILIAKDHQHPVRFVLGHELAHRMQILAPAEYLAFREHAARDSAVEIAIEERMALYAGNHLELTYEEALDEIAADYAGELFEGGKVLDDFIEAHRRDRTLLEKIRDVIRTMIDRLTGAERRRAQTAEGKLTAALEASARQVEMDSQDAAPVGSSKTTFSLRAFEDGTKYVEVDTDQERFNGLTTAQMQSEAKKCILERFRNKVIGTGYTAYVNKNSAQHYVFPANRRMDETQKRDKMQASTELDNLLSASTFRENVADDGRRPIATGGIDKLDTIFRINGRLYRAEITVLVTDHGRLFYDMTKFDDITGREIGQTQSAAETSNHAVKYSITQNGGSVKPQNSLRGEYDLLREARDLERRALEEGWSGERLRLEHGTASEQAYKALLWEQAAAVSGQEAFERLERVYRVETAKKHTGTDLLEWMWFYNMAVGRQENELDD